MCSISQACQDGSWSSWGVQPSISWAYWQLTSRAWEHSVFHGTHWFWWPWILQAPNTHPVQAPGASSMLDANWSIKDGRLLPHPSLAEIPYCVKTPSLFVVPALTDHVSYLWWSRSCQDRLKHALLETTRPNHTQQHQERQLCNGCSCEHPLKETHLVKQAKRGRLLLYQVLKAKYVLILKTDLTHAASEQEPLCGRPW